MMVFPWCSQSYPALPELPAGPELDPAVVAVDPDFDELPHPATRIIAAVKRPGPSTCSEAYTHPHADTRKQSQLASITLALAPAQLQTV